MNVLRCLYLPLSCGPLRFVGCFSQFFPSHSLPFTELMLAN